MSQSHTPASPLGRLTATRAKLALKRLYYIPVGLAVIGAVAGGVGAGLTRPAAEALVSLNTELTDATSIARASETMVREMRTDAVFNEASRALGESSDPTDLRQRTRIAAVTSTTIISVQVVGQDQDRAAAEANAVVTAAQTLEQDARKAELERVTTSIRQLMTSADSKVADQQAEQTRITRLGGALADSQASVATMASQLTSVQQARAVESTVGPLTLAAICGLGGALLGGGIALLLGVRRGPVQSMVELEQIFPHVPQITPGLLPDVLALEGERVDTVVISGTPDTADRLAGLRDRIAAQLHSDPAPRRDLTVLAAPLSETVLRRVSADPAVVLVLAVDPSTVRLEDLSAPFDRLSARSYLLEVPGSA